MRNTNGRRAHLLALPPVRAQRRILAICCILALLSGDLFPSNPTLGQDAQSLKEAFRKVNFVEPIRRFVDSSRAPIDRRLPPKQPSANLSPTQPASSRAPATSTPVSNLPANDTDIAAASATRRPAMAQPEVVSIPVDIASLKTQHTDQPTEPMAPLQPIELTTTECMVLDARQIGCRSAEKWIPSDILRQRARTLIQVFCEEDECSQQAARGLANFLCMQAERQDDIGAASALRAYYTRIAIVEQLALTERSLALVNEEEQKQQAAIEGGLPAGTDLTAFERHRLEIRDNQLQLLSQDRQLRCLLAQLADVDYAASEVCQERLEVFESPLDCQRLKQFALATRQDLRGWVYLCGQVNEESAPIFAKMIGTVVGNWGLPIPAIVGLKALLCPPDYAGLAANMQHELRLTADTHRKWICQAVEEKCAKLQLAYERIRIAQKNIESWEKRIEQLELLEEQGDGQPADLATARSELLKAHADEIARRLDAKSAEIDLAESGGGLSDRCCNGQPWLLTGYE